MTTGTGSPINPFGAIPSISIENAKVMEGIAFSARKRFTIAGAGVLDLIFNPTAFTGSFVVLLPFVFEALGGPINVDIYSGATANDDGTAIVLYNRSFPVGGVAASTLKSGSTGIVIAGITPIELFVPSTAVGVNASSGAASESLVTNLDPSVKYLVRLTNVDAAAVTLGLKLDFFEVP